MNTRSIRSRTAAALLSGAIAFVAGAPLAQAYTWTKKSSPPPHPVRSNFWESEVYQSGTVPVTLAPAVGYMDPYSEQDTNLNVLLNQKNSNGDFAVYNFESVDLEWSPLLGGYLSGLALDNANLAVWGVTSNGQVWTTYPDGSRWTHLWNNYTSVAVRKAESANPAGYLFATASNSTTDGSANAGPSGPSIELYDPAGEWPNGSWKSTGWGAYQVSGDPMGSDVAALDDNGVVWAIYPQYIPSLPDQPRIYLGWAAQQLSPVECSNSDAITFAQVAVKNGTFFGLDNFAGGGDQIANAVWYYTSDDCWEQVGSRANFLSIATDQGAQVLLWATDTSGDIWYAE